LSHSHFCDFAGHEWECTGTALRPLAGDTEPSVCMCAMHQVPLADGDHNECPIELLACPEHRDEQLRDMGELDSSDLPESQVDAESTMFRDNDGNPIVGFCLWCNKDFYSMEEAEAHNADDGKACPVFQELKDQGCGTPSF
jgi:hypothetical protein